jgi:hypothetical protein
MVWCGVGFVNKNDVQKTCSTRGPIIVNDNDNLSTGYTGNVLRYLPRHPVSLIFRCRQTTGWRSRQQDAFIDEVQGRYCSLGWTRDRPRFLFPTPTRQYSSISLSLGLKKGPETYFSYGSQRTNSQLIMRTWPRRLHSQVSNDHVLHCWMIVMLSLK